MRNQRTDKETIHLTGPILEIVWAPPEFPSKALLIPKRLDGMIKKHTKIGDFAGAVVC